MATTGERKTRRGFAVSCPHCGAADGIRVKADDLTMECSECAEEVTPVHVRAMIGEWTRLLSWVDRAGD